MVQGGGEGEEKVNKGELGDERGEERESVEDRNDNINGNLTNSKVWAKTLSFRQYSQVCTFHNIYHG